MASTPFRQWGIGKDPWRENQGIRRNKAAMCLTQFDTAKRTVYQKHFYKNTFYCAGEYYNHNPLTFLGAGLCSILNEVSRDLSDILE